MPNQNPKPLTKADSQGNRASSVPLQDSTSETELNPSTFGSDELGFLEKIMADWPPEDTAANPNIEGSKNDQTAPHNPSDKL